MTGSYVTTKGRTFLHPGYTRSDLRYPNDRGDHESQHLVPATERFAARTAGMTASEIRALFAVASRPEVVSLAGGMPNLAALPMDALAGEVADLVARDGHVALQ